ncbi:ubiquitin-protein ligase [Coprinopsis marcescibilis]|uniref:Anaphase-promoting complex subunit 2 n=1 Tax=Coprinopsis marcescibilis TaxID=230819 RepID=A0A5C3L2C0_COPMA|nr:ubiquitin-protein ligase [Coprinopsis marcescibilis]
MATPAFKNQMASKFTDAFNRLNRGEQGISGLITWSQAWTTVNEYLKPRDIKDSLYRRRKRNKADFDGARAAFAIIVRCRQLALVLEAFLDEIRKNFHLIEYEINEYMVRYERDENVELIRMLVSRLLDWYKAWAPPPELGPGVAADYTLAFQTRLFSALPPSFTCGFKSLCAWCLSPEEFPPSDSLSALTPNMGVVWRDFEALGLIDRYESVIASVGYERIEKQVVEVCEGNWAKPMMEELRNWMTAKVVPWMLQIYARGASSTEEARSMLQGVGSRFDFHINKTLCDLRTREIFDIIIDFPDSMGALQDLKECLQRVDQRGALVKTLRKANAKRLLHPGADTKLILSQYVATIKCLRIIDPPGVLLFKVADPIRRYLRDRPDTIRCIVASLVGDEDSGDSLLDDNEPIQPLQQSETEDYSDPMWEPEPIDAGPEFRTNKPSDVISTLVSIYDSKDLFVKELQALLAQRLLAIPEAEIYKVERERRNIEILKIRFGETALQVCEVMLRDMTDSRRMDGYLYRKWKSTMHPIVISKHFWPVLESSDLIMPGQFQSMQESYSKEFSLLKPDKKLRWLPHLGTVTIELVLQDRKLEVEVPPLEAAAIELFSQKDTWVVDDLLASLGNVDRASVVKALATWVNMGVLKEAEENVFVLLEVAEEIDENAVVASSAPLPAAGQAMAPIQTSQQQQAEKMRVYWKFIEGMLKNLGGLPIDRIQAMLKFVENYDQSIEQLGAFMEVARRENMVVCRDGVWRLNT